VSDDHEARIRERAYQFWVNEGRPDGRALEHWLRAEQEVDGQIPPVPTPKVATELERPDAVRKGSRKRERAKWERESAYQGAQPGSDDAPRSAEELAQDMGQSPGFVIPRDDQK
jgi:hypothetical protein